MLVNVTTLVFIFTRRVLTKAAGVVSASPLHMGRCWLGIIRQKGHILPYLLLPIDGIVLYITLYLNFLGSLQNFTSACVGKISLGMVAVSSCGSCGAHPVFFPTSLLDGDQA